MAINYQGKMFYDIGRQGCYRHCTVTPLFCVIKQYYDGNYSGIAVTNTTVIYCDISTLEITGIV